MIVEPTSLPDVILFTPRRITDSRGYFMETFRKDIFEELVGRNTDFVQENQSLSAHADTVRGLHYQMPPYAQGKLVRCLAGGVIDVAVDVRNGSPHYGNAVAIELSSDNNRQLWIPAGFLHGFRTLQDNTVVSYKCTSTYSHQHDGAVLWNDQDLNVPWGISTPKVLSERDQSASCFEAFDSPFTFETKR